MIFIPVYWSLDSKRDLNWRAINSIAAQLLCGYGSAPVSIASGNDLSIW
jgi:hypothetical protein